MKTFIDIPNYEWRYQINKLSEVKSLERKVKTWRNWYRIVKEKILKPYINKNWYVYIWLYKHWKLKLLRLNRLMWLSFLELKKSSKKVVLHKDNNKLNNKLDNLKLDTSLENTKQCIKDGRFITHKKKRACSYYRWQTLKIRFLRLIWKTNWEIAKKYWISKSYVSLIYNKKRRVYIK